MPPMAGSMLPIAGSTRWATAAAVSVGVPRRDPAVSSGAVAAAVLSCCRVAASLGARAAASWSCRCRHVSGLPAVAGPRVHAASAGAAGCRPS